MPRRHRRHSAEFRRQVVSEFQGGETLHALGRRHDLSRNQIRVWIEKAEAGALDQDVAAAELMADHEARIVALERLAEQGFFGSMSRRGNPYEFKLVRASGSNGPGDRSKAQNAKAQSVMKTLKVEDAYLMEYETLDDVATGPPRFIEAYNHRRLRMSIRRGALQ
ncbi:transposase [Salipiger sp. HF18]|uniref:transposase n=1 Tax=Salipiger sp. HF18 TaxID=2721557 RepID=UPI0020CAA6D0|nr:transposase [Salipiger sp. HF18]